jgi:Tfp pilus assembly protein PilE
VSAPPPVATKSKNTGNWILVAVGGCLSLLCVAAVVAAIAIPAFITYVKRSKAAEASVHLSAMRHGAVAHCTTHGTFPAAGPLPLHVGSERQMASFGSDPGFVALDLRTTEPVYYRLSAVPDAAGGATLVAEGDLDGDGVFSRFELRCYSGCTCDGTPSVTNELE